jgi:hypothetical protein
MVAFWETPEKFVIGVIVEIHSLDRGLSGYKPKTYYTIDWMHPSYPRDEMVDTSKMNHFRQMYLRIVERGLI